MRIMVIGASRGLGNAGDTLIGVSRTLPDQLPRREEIAIDWVSVDVVNLTVREMENSVRSKQVGANCQENFGVVIVNGEFFGVSLSSWHGII